MKVLIIDDDKLVCSSLNIILSSDPEIEVVGLGYSGADAFALYEALRPDMVLMDIRMEPISGLEVGEQLMSQYQDVKILYLTTFLDDEYIINALRLGAKGYMLKQNYESILPSLKAVWAGQNVYGEEIITKLPKLMERSHESIASIPSILSPREYEIIEKIADGLSNKEISETLFLSDGTIRNNISTILEKLNLRDRTQIAIYYYKHLIP